MAREERVAAAVASAQIAVTARMQSKVAKSLVSSIPLIVEIFTGLVQNGECCLSPARAQQEIEQQTSRAKRFLKKQATKAVREHERQTVGPLRDEIRDSRDMLRDMTTREFLGYTNDNPSELALMMRR